MLKSNRREAMIFLLGGLAAVGGSNLTDGKQASFPKDCKWELFPFLFTDLSKINKELETSPWLLEPHIVPRLYRLPVDEKLDGGQ